MTGALSVRTRHTLIPMVGLIAALTLAGCGITVSGPPPEPGEALQDPSATPSPTTAVATAAPTSTPPLVAAPAYPSTARAYAEAVLDAWRQKQVPRLGDLTTPLVQDQILSIPGPPDQAWSHDRCDAAIGSMYCVFINNDGDVITLRISNQLLGKAHAAYEVALDQTEYSLDAKQYAQAFVEAWRNSNTKRMLAMSSPAGVEFFTHYPPPSTYQVCARLVTNTWRVRIYNAAGMNYRVLIPDSARGRPHAITDPVIGPLPPECT